MCFYDPVDDLCTLRYGNNTVTITGVGFIEPFETGSFDWKDDPVAYCSIAYRLKVLSVKIKYKDNTVQIYNQQQILKMY